MSQRPLKTVLVTALVTLAFAPVLASCGAAQSALGAVGDVTGGAVGGKCPDVRNLDALLAYDFQAGFKIDANAAAKLKAGTVAAVELQEFAAKVNADLASACAAIANDLGQSADAKDAKSACEAAVSAIGATKAKLGANAKMELVVREPRCRVDLQAYGDCAAKCDASVQPGQVKVECEPGKLSGTCTAECSGRCDLSAAAKCDGQCAGTCEGTIRGGCSGKCNGKCDGKASNGAACAGVCEGKCEGGRVDGSCSGSCKGSCQLKAAAKCDGTCTGSCSTEFKEPKCAGDVRPPKVSAECNAQCDTRVSSHAECTPAEVGLAITGAADAGAATQLKTTIERNLPLVLKVAIGLGESSVKMAANAGAVVEGVQGSVDVIARTSGDAARAGLIAGQITTCLGETFKGALGAAGSLKASVSVSVDVKASVSGSASGRAGG